MSTGALPSDFRDVLRLLLAAQAEFLLVGAHAMAVHGVPRATGDLDLWINPTLENARKVYDALAAFGAPLAEHRVTPEHLAQPDVVYQLGVPPRRIDILTSLSGLDFAAAWQNRVDVAIGDLRVPVLGREDLIRNKQATGREKDVYDARLLESQGGIRDRQA